MSIAVSIQSFQGKERKEIIEEVQHQMQEAALQATKHILTAYLEAEVTAKLGREKGGQRRVSSQTHEIDWKCRHCGCQDANQFTRTPRRMMLERGGQSKVSKKVDTKLCDA